MELTYSLDEIEQIAAIVLKEIKDENIIAFYGNLGAGKTTLITTLCEQLGVAGNVSSPTFSIINEYKTNEGRTIYHMDLYRLRDEHEAREAGVEECLDSNHLCLVEWPERAENLLQTAVLKVYLTVVSATERKMNITRSPKND